MDVVLFLIVIVVVFSIPSYVGLVFAVGLFFTVPAHHGRTRWWGLAFLVPLIGLYAYAFTVADETKTHDALATG